MDNNYRNPKKREQVNQKTDVGTIKGRTTHTYHTCHDGVWDAHAMEEVDDKWSKGW